jgi:hypothetical protein
MSYQKNMIKLYIRLIANSIREEFILTNIYTYIRIIIKKLSRFYLQRIIMLYKIKEMAIKSNSIIQILPV